MHRRWCRTLSIAWAVGAMTASSFATLPPAVANMPTPANAARLALPAAIVFARLQGDPENYEIWTMGIHGGNQQRLTSNEVADHEPQWSPDGTSIVWVRHESQYNGGMSDLWLMDADGSNKHKLTDHGDGITGPTWSPDGAQLAFTRNHGISVINADGTGEHRISPADSFDFGPAWSPDGAQIVFVSEGERSPYDLFVMRPDGSARHQLAGTPGILDDDPAWSPDGRRIAFSGSHQGIRHVDMMRSDGTGIHIVIDMHSVWPAWSPDGSKLAFSACGDLDCGLYRSSWRGRHIRPLGRIRGFSDIQPDYREVLPG